MGTRQRPGPGSLSERLRQQPYTFELMQALLVLEREVPNSKSLACGIDPRHEVVSLRGPLTPVFASSQISRIESPSDTDTATDTGKPDLILHTPVFGLGGPDGPLPYAYQEWLQQRARVKDEATGEFLDLFQHRLLSLWYRVQRKHRLALPFSTPQNSPVYKQLKALNGLPSAHNDAQSQPITARTALFANGRRSLAGLQNLVRHHFDVSTRLEGFQGAWIEVPPASRTVLGRRGRNQALGRNTLAGAHVWDQQAGVRITLGPLTAAQASTFLPDRPAHRELAQMVGFYLGTDFQCGLRLRLSEASPIKLGVAAEPAQLGRGTWLVSEAGPGDYGIDLQLNLNKDV